MNELSLETAHPISIFIQKALGDAPYRIMQLAGDASARRYFRVVQKDQPYVLMVWEPFEDNDGYPFLSVLNYFSQHGIAVPKVFAKSPQDGFILLEDLGDLTLERKFWENQDQEASLPYYQQALDELVKVHFLSKDENCTAFKNSFDIEKLHWEFRYAVKHLLIEFCRAPLSDSVVDELNKLFVRICEHLAEQPQVVCHRDFHSRNVMIKYDKVSLIDFQDARLGPAQYDLVSLLRDSYVNLNTKNQSTLLSYYLQKLKTEKVDQKFGIDCGESFFHTYEIQTIQRCFKACGSFASFFNDRNDKRYLKYLPETLLRVRKSLSLFPEYGLLQQVLSDNGIFEYDFHKRAHSS